MTQRDPGRPREQPIGRFVRSPGAATRNRTLTVAGLLFVLLAAVLVTGVTAGSSGAASSTFSDRTFRSFTASNGLTSQYHVYAADLAEDEPICAVFQFHGDGAYEFEHSTSSYSLGGSRGIVAVSRERGCLTVPVLTPDTVGARTWWESGAKNAIFFRDLLSAIKAEYRIDSERIWLVGYSGGAQFITRFYLPLYSSTIDGGGAVVFGGGGAPYNITPKPPAAALVSDFRLHWYTGADDTGRRSGYNALRDAKAGEAHYAAKGFGTSHEYPADTGHDLSGRFGGVLAQQMDRAR